MSYSLHNSEVFRVLHTQIYPRYGGTREPPIATMSRMKYPRRGEVGDGITVGKVRY